MPLLLQQDVGPAYQDLDEKTVLQRIQSLKKRLTEKLLILGHNYQQEAVIQFADQAGDSLKLARYAAATKDKEFIVFCGVHFMAETADILTSEFQKVILPDVRAGCPMADMASLEELLWAWESLSQVVPKGVVPITYINSPAGLKAFVGDRGGSVCTSSNAHEILQWAFSKGEKVFFFPDEHLGRNTCYSLGIPLEDMLVWQRDKPLGGNSAEGVKRAKVFLWNGYCTVHQMFRPEHVKMWRKRDPDIKIIVHPECMFEVVQAADYYGSTEKIIKTVNETPRGTKWAIGTEINLVTRLQKQNPDKFITSLSPFQCLCATMYRIKPVYLLWALDNLAVGKVVNRIKVEKPTAGLARLALDRMFTISG
jgi:quinolinate synthase